MKREWSYTAGMKREWSYTARMKGEWSYTAGMKRVGSLDSLHVKVCYDNSYQWSKCRGSESDRVNLSP